MKTVALSLLIFFQLGCFPLTRTVIRVKDHRPLDVKSMGFDKSNQDLVITTTREIIITGLKLNKSFCISAPDFSPNLIKTIRVKEILRYNLNRFPAMPENMQMVDNVSVTADGYRNSKNPIRWLCSPFTVAGDILLGIFTLGQVNEIVSHQMIHMEVMTSSIQIKTGSN